jgi:hypothetical protein
VKPFRFRALVTLDPPTTKRAGGRYGSGIRSLVVHARRTGEPACDRYFPAVIAAEDGLPLRPGNRTVVTITVTDDDAPAYFSPGQAFTLWGECGGYGVVSRRLLNDSGAS